jgi:hypothetical protein
MAGLATLTTPRRQQFTAILNLFIICSVNEYYLAVGTSNSFNPAKKKKKKKKRAVLLPCML